MFSLFWQQIGHTKWQHCILAPATPMLLGFIARKMSQLPLHCMGGVTETLKCVGGVGHSTLQAASGHSRTGSRLFWLEGPIVYSWKAWSIMVTDTPIFGCGGAVHGLLGYHFIFFTYKIKAKECVYSYH